MYHQPGAFKVSVTELLSGNAVTNMNISANMLRSKFYVCPICGNVIHSMGETVISCHGIQLLPEEAEEAGDSISVERVEDDHYITVDHLMTKSDYISFIAVVSYDSVEIKKLYPEGPAEARFKITGQKKYISTPTGTVFFTGISDHRLFFPFFLKNSRQISRFPGVSTIFRLFGKK